jgi:hypothetical protein
MLCRTMSERYVNSCIGPEDDQCDQEAKIIGTSSRQHLRAEKDTFYLSCANYAMRGLYYSKIILSVNLAHC